ncbi:MAG: hypothetical protein AAFV86_24185, partial [Pseudomonadota bacterium]
MAAAVAGDGSRRTVRRDRAPLRGTGVVTGTRRAAESAPSDVEREDPLHRTQPRRPRDGSPLPPPPTRQAERRASRLPLVAALVATLGVGGVAGAAGMVLLGPQDALRAALGLAADRPAASVMVASTALPVAGSTARDGGVSGGMAALEAEIRRLETDIANQRAEAAALAGAERAVFSTLRAELARARAERGAALASLADARTALATAEDRLEAAADTRAGTRAGTGASTGASTGADTGAGTGANVGTDLGTDTGAAADTPPTARTASLGAVAGAVVSDAVPDAVPDAEAAGATPPVEKALAPPAEDAGEVSGEAAGGDEPAEEGAAAPATEEEDGTEVAGSALTLGDLTRPAQTPAAVPRQVTLDDRGAGRIPQRWHGRREHQARDGGTQERLAKGLLDETERAARHEDSESRLIGLGPPEANATGTARRARRAS